MVPINNWLTTADAPSADGWLTLEINSTLSRHHVTFGVGRPTSSQRKKKMWENFHRFFNTICLNNFMFILWEAGREEENNGKFLPPLWPCIPSSPGILHKPFYGIKIISDFSLLFSSSHGFFSWSSKIAVTKANSLWLNESQALGKLDFNVGKHSGVIHL